MLHFIFSSLNSSFKIPDNNTKDFTTSTFEHVHLWKRAELCAQIMALIFGIFGNAMIVFITANNKKFHLTRACLICSTAISYLLFCIALILIRLYLLQIFEEEYVLCMVSYISGFFTFSLSHCMIFILSLDGLIAVCWPIYYSRDRTIKYAISMVGIAVCVPVIFTLIFLFIATEEKGLGLEVLLNMFLQFIHGNFDSKTVISQICVRTVKSIPPAFPMFAVPTIFVFIAMQIRMMTVKKAAIHRPQENHLVIQQVILISRLMALIYIVTWSFIFVVFLVKIISGKVVGEIVWELNWLHILSIISDFPIYLWRSKEFRKTFLEKFCCYEKNGSNINIILPESSINETGNAECSKC